MSEIVIIGAGPTGLSAAYHLEKMGFDDFKIFEAEDTAGGLCRSIIQDGFTFDFTGHLFHVNDNYVKTFIDSVIGFENFNNIIRRSYVYSQDIYTKYPYQVNMYGLPLETIAECIEGFIKRDASEKKCKTFAEWVLQNFGRGFAKHFFYPYQEKIFCYSVNKLSASWTGKFVPKVSLKELLKGSLTDVNDAIGYNSQFYYPKKGGINFWVDKFAKKLKTEIHTSHKVDHIDMVKKVVKFSNGHEEKYKTLISTMPLDFLLKNSKQPHKSTLGKTAAKLLCNSVINVNLGVKRPQLSDKHWIYFPEKKYPFYRAGFWHNFSKHMTPDGCSSIYLELSYLKKSEKSYPHDDLKKSIETLKKLLSIDNREIVTQKIIHIDRAYVIYDQWRDANLHKILKRLEEIDIHSVGRYGGWKYSSMQDAIIDGKAIAEKLLVPEVKKKRRGFHYASK